MKAIKDVTIAMLLSAILAIILIPGIAAAQEEAIPSLRLDRLPILPAFVGQTHAPAAEPSEYKVETVLDGLSFPWALAVLPNGDLILAERRNGLKIFSNGKLSEPLNGLPAASEYPNYPAFGWFDVALDPDFEANRWVYFSYYAVAGDDPEARGIARVSRARLSQDQMSFEDLEIIIDGNGTQEIHFAKDGTLMVVGSGSFDNDPQDLGVATGKLLRVNPNEIGRAHV